MKRLKLLFATLVAVFSVFAGNTAFAEGSYTITINNPVEGHTYEAFQVFKGDLSGDTLSNIQWGSNVDASTLGSAEETAKKLESATFNSTEAKNFATLINEKLTGGPAGSGTATITGLAAGYYLIRDKTDATSAFILTVVKDVAVTPKIGVPKVEKKVKDINDTTDAALSGWQDSADHDINDKVPFQLTATLPANYDSYNSYFLSFTDELSAGLTYNGDAKVYVVNGDERKDVTNYFYVASNGAQYAIQDLKQIAVDGAATINKDTKIVVEYTATLNEKAIFGSKGNPNTVKLTYSNNPNNSGEGNQKPNTPPTPPTTPPTTPPGGTEETPRDTVIVFTYKTVVNKVNQNQQPLAGAEFTLSKKMKDGSLKEVKVVKNTDGTEFSFNGLDDGTYVLKETKTPAGYNSIADIEFTVTAEHDILSDAPALKSLSGNAKSGELEFTSNQEAGSLTTKVVNKSGSILPSTGSVGTTLLYVVGTILALAAGILLVTKKRMEA